MTFLVWNALYMCIFLKPTQKLLDFSCFLPKSLLIMCSLIGNYGFDFCPCSVSTMAYPQVNRSALSMLQSAFRHRGSLLSNLNTSRALASTPTQSTQSTQTAQSAQPVSSHKAQPSNSANKTGSKGPVSWRGLALVGGLGTMGLVYYSHERERRIKGKVFCAQLTGMKHIDPLYNHTKLIFLIEITSPKTLGRASIGGTFNLTDEDGKPYTEKELLGRWTLIYFGFTMCPDICPAELTKVGEALEKLEKRGRNVSPTKNDKTNGRDMSISPLFISIDPERDSPKRSAEYARGFHQAFTGVSGTVEQVTDVAKKYRVYFSKDESPDGDDDYLVDHSIVTYLIDPKGEFQEFYGKNASAAEIASRIEARLLAWNE